MSTVTASVTTLPRNGDATNSGIRNRESVPATMQKERKEQTPKAKVMHAPSDFPTKGRKRVSPFRIKAGCLVALRHRDGGNKVAVVSPSGKTNDLSNLRSVDHFVEAWADPVPGRDAGLALIGKRVRCFFPKFVTEKSQPKRATTRILEGEIVAIIDYESNYLIQQQKRRNREGCHLSVELLVDERALTALPFLERVDDENKDFESLRPSEKKRRQYEEIIRGKNKITVKVTLADNSGIVISKTASKKFDLLAKWVIRKRVPLQTTGPTRYEQLLGEEPISSVAEETLKENSSASHENGVPAHSSGPDNGTVPESKVKAGQRVDSSLEPPKKRAKTKKGASELTKSRYLGDGNDAVAQQETNWRWWAGRSHYMELFASSGKRLGCLEQISNGFVGEVLSVKPEPPQSSTLATVTVRRMILPEHTVNGRLIDDSLLQLYDDKDTVVEGNSFLTFQIPVEELVIVCRGITRSSQVPASAEMPQNTPTVSLSYSLQQNIFTPITTANKLLPSGGLEVDVKVCHRCKITLPTAEMESCSGHCCMVLGDQNERPSKSWCSRCVRFLQRSSDGELIFPCCSATCTCGECSFIACSQSQFGLREDVIGALSGCAQSEKYPNSIFIVAHRSIEGIEPTDFNLPGDLLERPPVSLSSGKPITRIPKPRSQRKDKKPPDKKGADGKTAEGKSKRKSNTKGKNGQQSISQESEPPSVTEQSQLCSRVVPYDPKSKSMNAACSADAEKGNIFANVTFDKPRNLRQLQLLSAKPEKEDKTNNNRAARANQRRIMKDVAALGATSLGLDTLAGREQKLRFDRSGIHAWGVFADEAIAGGDMIVEYRGELIGNAMAEKREKEYEKAKIGSDYMFRVDSQVVCDATKQGNVARFINASCDPNCYTKTITVDGTKRIVIYAKRDIRAGEELCYDYKFPLEYDEAKRIPCFCGARECRGFMNWNKRYVALPIPNSAVTDDGALRRGSLKHTEE